MNIQSIWLRRDGNNAQVLIEVDGVWYNIIEEPHDCPFSHTVHEGGFQHAIDNGNIINSKEQQ